MELKLPKTDSRLPEGDKGVVAEFKERWRGHKAGTVARLTSERFDQLAKSGIVEQAQASELVAAAQPQRSAKRKSLNADPNSYTRSSDRADKPSGS